MNKILLFLLLSFTLLVASIDINKASKAELMQIKGIGAKKAQSIVEYRKKHGKFKSVNDLKNVKGVGAGIVKNVKNGTKNSTKKKATKTNKKSSSKKTSTSKTKKSTSKTKKSVTKTNKSASKTKTKAKKAKKSKKAKKKKKSKK